MMLTTHFFHFHVLSTWFVLTCQPMCVWNIVLLFHKENIIMYLYFTKKKITFLIFCEIEILPKAHQHCDWFLEMFQCIWHHISLPGISHLKKKIKFFFLIFLQNLWNVNYSFVLEFLLYMILNSIYKNFWISSSISSILGPGKKI